MAADEQTALSAALDSLWIRFLPQIKERLGVLDAAAQALALGPLSAERQQEAQAAAHKLAGALGTFGLADGTVLARELETTFSGQIDPEAGLAGRIAAIAAELRIIVANRK
jgi:HPt (histidine-containing phosphotransfer) domain-containing protein